jgi:hypothetical protein
MEEAESTPEIVLIGDKNDNTPNWPTKVGQDVMQQGLHFLWFGRSAPYLVHSAAAIPILLVAGTKGVVGGLSIELLISQGDWTCASHFVN